MKCPICSLEHEPAKNATLRKTMTTCIGALRARVADLEASLRRTPLPQGRERAFFMDERDVFAAHALTGLIARRDWSFPVDAVKQAYEYADALLAVRKAGM